MDRLNPTRALIVQELARVGARQIAGNPGFRGKNFVTPNLIGFYSLGESKLEISTGSGIFDRSETLIGLTVLGDENQERGGCLSTLDELREKLEGLAA